MSSTKMTKLQFVAMLFIGHMTTAPWNSFINNQNFFEWKLKGSTTANFTNIIEKQVVCLKLDCTQNETITTVNILTECKMNQTITKDSYDSCMHQEDKYPLATFWSSSLTSISLAVSLISAIIGTILLKVIPEKIRVYGVFSIVSIIFALQIIFAWTVNDILPFFILTLTCAAVIIFSAMLFQATIFSLVGPMYFMYVVTLMEGQAIGGMLISFIKMICDEITIGGDKVKQVQTTIYWTTGLVIMVIITICWKKVFIKSEEYINCRQNSVEEKTNLVEPNSKNDDEITLKEILNSIKIQAFSVALNFGVCLLLFPAVLMKYRNDSVKPDIFGIKQVDYSKFLSFGVFFVFNLGDWLGKKSGQFAIFEAKSEGLLGLSVIVRCLFIPVIMGLNLTGVKTGWQHSKYVFIIINFLFAFTSGYFGSLCMRFAPEILELKLNGKYTQDQIKAANKRTGPIMVIFLISGLLIGSLLSYVPVGIIDKWTSAAETLKFNEFVEKIMTQ